MSDKDNRPKSCATCKYTDLGANEQPCDDCCFIARKSHGETMFNKWEEATMPTDADSCPGFQRKPKAKKKVMEDNDL